MQLLRDPSPRKLEKFISKTPLSSATVLHWTGSMWGIGCRLSALSALERIRKLKQRPEKQGFIALIPDISVLDSSKIPTSLNPLIQQYLPGNLSIVLSYDDPLFEQIAVEGKVAFRVPADPLLRAFIAELGEPLISTSINVSGLPPEDDLDRIKRNFATWFDFALLPPPSLTKGIAEQSTIVEYVRASEAKHSSRNDELRCLREGSIPFYEIKQSFKMPLVMFVCTANICRSPIAEKLFRVMIEKDNLALASDSCGLLDGGHTISPKSMMLLVERGITEAQSHVSKKHTPQLITASWLILTMEERHRNTLRELYPNEARKIFTLNEIVGEEGDIADPYQSELENYQFTFNLIETRLIQLMQLIKTNKLSFTALPDKH